MGERSNTLLGIRFFIPDRGYLEVKITAPLLLSDCSLSEASLTDALRT